MLAVHGHYREHGMRHRRSVNRLLERQGWEISDRSALADLAIEGARARIVLTVSTENNLSTTSARFDARDIDLRSIEGVVVTCALRPARCWSVLHEPASWPSMSETSLAWTHARRRRCRFSVHNCDGL